MENETLWHGCGNARRGFDLGRKRIRQVHLSGDVGDAMFECRIGWRGDAQAAAYGHASLPG